MSQRIRSADGLLRKVPAPGQPILPIEGEDNILITSSLPYCNNVPHLGNIVGSVLSADAYSRYSRSRNRNTLYICGTDEYGTATETQALKEGISPRELCDKYHKLHKETYDWFNIHFDHFGRTSTDLHTQVCQEIYHNLGQNGYLEKQDKEQLYCEGCPKFLADRYVEGTCLYCSYEDARGDQCDACGRTLDATIELVNPRCLVNKSHKVTTKISTHMYLKLDKIQPKTEEWIKKSWLKGKWGPNSVINGDGELVDARLKMGLQPTPLTRDLKWGVPVLVEKEEDEPLRGKVMYVWYDAPIGYPSITAAYTSEWKKWWFNPEHVNLYQFMGKDNVYFHTVYFPSIQLSDGRPWTTLHHLSTTEYLNYEGGKFSKSRNRGVFGVQAKETGIKSDVWRFYLLSTRPETGDSMFSWDDCITANNSILLNNFGNFVNRTLKFIVSQYDSTIPETSDPPGPLSPSSSGDPDMEFITEVNSLLQAYITAMDAVKLRLGLQTIMLISNRGNQYLQSSGLNKQLKESNPERCATVINRAANLIWLLSPMIGVYMPDTERRILEQLNAPERSVGEVFGIDLLGGHKVGKVDHLFKKIEDGVGEKWRKRFGGSEEATAPTAADAAAGTTTANKKHHISEKDKTPEMKALEQQITEQGNLVRELKAQNPRTKEVEGKIKDEVDVLKKLKVELAGLSLN